MSSQESQQKKEEDTKKGEKIFDWYCKAEKGHCEKFNGVKFTGKS